MKEIEAIKEALAAGPTPGPWIVGKYQRGTTIATVCHVSEFSVGPDGESYDDHGPCKTDADYIAACSPAAMTAVIAHSEAQRQLIQGYVDDKQELEERVKDQAAEIERLRADAERYRALRSMAVRLSLPHETISMLVTNQAELDAAMKETP